MVLLVKAENRSFDSKPRHSEEHVICNTCGFPRQRELTGYRKVVNIRGCHSKNTFEILQRFRGRIKPAVGPLAGDIEFIFECKTRPKTDIMLREKAIRIQYIGYKLQSNQKASA